MDYTRLPANTDVVSFGDKGDKFYIIVEGECQIWTPILHIDIRDIIKNYLKDLDKMVNSVHSQTFFTPCNENGEYLY